MTSFPDAPLELPQQRCPHCGKIIGELPVGGFEAHVDMCGATEETYEAEDDPRWKERRAT